MSWYRVVVVTATCVSYGRHARTSWRVSFVIRGQRNGDMIWIRFNLRCWRIRFYLRCRGARIIYAIASVHNCVYNNYSPKLDVGYERQRTGGVVCKSWMLSAARLSFGTMMLLGTSYSTNQPCSQRWRCASLETRIWYHAVCPPFKNILFELSKQK